MATVKICDLCDERMETTMPPGAALPRPNVQYKNISLPGVWSGSAVVTISVSVTKGNLSVNDVCQKCIEKLARRAIGKLEVEQTFDSSQAEQTFGPLQTDTAKEVLGGAEVIDQRKGIEPW